VEAVPQRTASKAQQAANPVRQVPHNAPSRRATRQVAQGRIRPSRSGKGSTPSSRARYTNLLSRHEKSPWRRKRSASRFSLAAKKRSTRPTFLKEAYGSSGTNGARGAGPDASSTLASSLNGSARNLRALRRYDRPPMGRHRCHGKPENKVSLGRRKAFNNKIRVFRDAPYGARRSISRSMVLTCMLPTAMIPKIAHSIPEDPFEKVSFDVVEETERSRLAHLTFCSSSELEALQE